MQPTMTSESSRSKRVDNPLTGWGRPALTTIRQTLLTLVIYRIPLLGGLALGLYAFLIGITGSVLVFWDPEAPQLE